MRILPAIICIVLIGCANNGNYSNTHCKAMFYVYSFYKPNGFSVYKTKTSQSYRSINNEFYYRNALDTTFSINISTAYQNDYFLKYRKQIDYRKFLYEELTDRRNTIPDSNDASGKIRVINGRTFVTINYKIKPLNYEYSYMVTFVRDSFVFYIGTANYNSSKENRLEYKHMTDSVFSSIKID